MPLSRDYFYNVKKDNKRIMEEIRHERLAEKLLDLPKGSYEIEIIKIDFYNDGYPCGYQVFKTISFEVK